MENTSFADLMQRLQSGDPTAADDIFRRYACQLIRLASPKVVGKLRQKVDPEDLVQSVFRSFFRVKPAEAFTLGSWDDLWGLLATITLRKCRHWVRYFLADKRDMGREQAADRSTESSTLWEAVAREPSPSEAAVLEDLIQKLLEGLDPKSREIAELALQGHPSSEIASQVGLTERSVYRQLEKIRKKLKDMQTGED